MNIKRRLDVLLLCVLLSPLATADQPAAAEAPSTTPAKSTWQVVDVPLSTLDSYVGRYKLKPDDHPSGDRLTLFRDRGHFLVQLANDLTFEVFPASSVRFFGKSQDTEFTIEKDGDEHVTGVTFVNKGKKRTGKKISSDPGLDDPWPMDA